MVVRAALDLVANVLADLPAPVAGLLVRADDEVLSEVVAPGPAAAHSAGALPDKLSEMASLSVGLAVVEVKFDALVAKQVGPVRPAAAPSQVFTVATVLQERTYH